MNSCIVRSRRTRAFILPIVLVILAVGFSGGFSALARAGDASLAFVGHLISGLHDGFSLDRLDPTFPRCF